MCFIRNVAMLISVSTCKHVFIASIGSSYNNMPYQTAIIFSGIGVKRNSVLFFIGEHGIIITTDL